MDDMRSEWMERQLTFFTSAPAGKEKESSYELIVTNEWIESEERDRGSEKGPPTHTHTAHTYAP